MADYDGLTPGQVLADASVAEFIKSLGLGIAEAQKALDENSINQIAEFIVPREGLGGKTLMDLGLSPAFYHYQYADLSCSLQLSLKVEKDMSLGLNLSGSYKSGSTQSGNTSSSETSSESGSSTSTETRKANVEITSASTGALNVGGQAFSLSGDNPAERMHNLQNALTSNSNSGIARVLYQLQPTPLNITTDADPNKVQVSDNAIAFISGGHDAGIIRIGTNANTDYTLDNTPNTITASTTAQDSLANYANHVKTQIEAKGYDTDLVSPSSAITSKLFNTGEHTLPRDENLPASMRSLMRLAQAIKRMNLSVTIEGFADRQQYARGNSDALNKQLGDNRAREIRNILIANGAPANSITLIPSRGDGAAADAGDPVGRDNQYYRRADIRVVNRTHYWLFVKAKSGGPNLESVAPDKQGDNSADNGFIYLYKPTPLALSGKKVTIDGTDFPLSGAAISGGSAAGTAEAYAQNLANDINAHTTANLKASASANVVTVSKDGDKFQLTLVTAEQREITLSGSSGVTVTEQFSRTRSASQTRQNTGNRTVAVGASVDARFSRKFEMNVSGNSSISARLVSIPAPPQFLETIRNFTKKES